MTEICCWSILYIMGMALNPVLNFKDLEPHVMILLLFTSGVHTLSDKIICVCEGVRSSLRHFWVCCASVAGKSLNETHVQLEWCETKVGWIEYMEKRGTRVVVGVIMRRAGGAVGLESLYVPRHFPDHSLYTTTLLLYKNRYEYLRTFSASFAAFQISKVKEELLDASEALGCCQKRPTFSLTSISPMSKMPWHNAMHMRSRRDSVCSLENDRRFCP
jgi:hypothetical protein